MKILLKIVFVLLLCVVARVWADDSPNVVPTAVLKVNPTTGDVPLTVFFDASGSTDSDGSIKQYWYGLGADVGLYAPATGLIQGEWDQVPSAVLKHTYTKPGLYAGVNLKVQDDDGEWSVPTPPLTIIVKAIPPTAVLSATPITGEAPLAVEFDASGSTGGSGTVETIWWDYGEGDPDMGDQFATTHIYETPGIYSAKLWVKDDYSATSAPVLVTITVTGTEPPNSPEDKELPPIPEDKELPPIPEDEVLPPIPEGEEPDPNTLEGEEPDPNIPEGEEPDPNTPEGEEPDPNIPEGEESDPNIPPTAVLSATPITGEAPLTVYFNGIASYDVDGTVKYYTFGIEGAPTLEAIVESSITQIFNEPGNYTVALKVQDNDGAWSVPPHPAVTITVTEPPNSPEGEKPDPNIPPIAVLIPASPTIGEAPLQVKFDGSGSYDVDGAVKYYTFGIEGAPTLESIVESSITQIFNEPGNYTVTLKVQDNDGAWSVPPHPAVTITVKDEPKKGTEKSVEKAAAKKAEKEAADKRKAELKRQADEVIKKAEEQRKAAEKEAEDKRKAEEQRKAEEKAAEDKRKAEEKAAEDKRNAERERQAEEEGEAADDSRQERSSETDNTRQRGD